MNKAQSAINESIESNEIVHLSWTAEAEETLTVECEDSAEAGGIKEYWGADWRVHLHR